MERLKVGDPTPEGKADMGPKRLWAEFLNPISDSALKRKCWMAQHQAEEFQVGMFDP